MATRGLFGVAPYRAYWQEGSSVRAPQSTPQPPKQPFLTGSDPWSSSYPAARDQSDILGPNLQASISTLSIRRFFTTDIPVPAYRTVITMIRGRASAAVSPGITSPSLQTILTDPPFRPTLRSDDQIFPPFRGQYDPFGSGAFFATVVPFRERYPWADASLLIPEIQPPPLTLTVSQRIFATLLFYQTPHRQEGSLLIATPGGVSAVVPLELRRFFASDWAWRLGPTYAVDASWFQLPQTRITPALPPPTFHGRTLPQWLRRLEMLQRRPHFMADE